MTGLIGCRHCGDPIAVDDLGLWSHTTGIVGCIHDDGFLPTKATPGPGAVDAALARDDLVLASYVQKHLAPGS
jgi:hypothetical protein